MKQITLFHRLSTDLLIYLSSYCDSLRAYIRLLIASKLIIDLNQENDIFWMKLLKEFLRYHGKDLEEVLFNYRNLHTSAQDSNKRGYTLCKDLFIDRRCSRSGCFKHYEEWNNHNTACLYHPGRMKNSYLTCCRARSFQSEGCKKSHHSGIFHFMLHSERETGKAPQALSLPGIAQPSSIDSARGSSGKGRVVTESVKLPSIK